ncbi:MAG: phosphatase PAP2 family protein [Gemmatimonadota bacterium]|nr:phosphatase PAP2 family protein [Gemmatimonadota bacterium]
MASVARRCRAVAACAVVVVPRGAVAQSTVVPSSRAYWLSGAAAIAAGIAFDTQLRDLALRNHTPGLDRVAGGLDPFGRAKYLVPALVAGYALPLALRQHRWADAALRVGLAYAVSDGVESVLKPLVGRHRPTATGNAWTFHPLATTDEWHSFPSAHSVHAFSIAAAVSDEAQNRWVTVAAYGTAGLVATQRVYRQAHWTSDVITSAVLAIATSRTTVHWLAEHGLGRLLGPVARNEPGR